MQCAGYTKTLDLRHGDLVKLADARGTTLRVARGTLWVTQEHDRSDVVLNTGDVWTVERDGLTLPKRRPASRYVSSDRAPSPPTCANGASAAANGCAAFSTAGCMPDMRRAYLDGDPTCL